VLLNFIEGRGSTEVMGRFGLCGDRQAASPKLEERGRVLGGGFVKKNFGVLRVLCG
jgi:hypothetical protein